MKAIFDFKRFILLLKNRIAENKKKYLLFLLLILVMSVVCISLFFLFSQRFVQYSYTRDALGSELVSELNHHWESFQESCFWIGLVIGGGLFAATSFVNFSNPGERIFYLNKPASSFEKWLVEFSIHIVLYSLSFFFIFYLFAFSLTFIINLINESELSRLINGKDLIEYSELEIRFNPKIIYHETFNPFENSVEKGGVIGSLVIFNWVYLFHGFIMFGVVLFDRFSTVKMALISFAIFLFFITIHPVLHEIIIPQNWNYRTLHEDAERLSSVGEDEIRATVNLGKEYQFRAIEILSFLALVWMHSCTFVTLKNKKG